MGEAKNRRALISVLIPERERPQELARLIASLVETAGDDRAYEIIVAIDDDDPAWEGRELPSGAQVRAYRGPRPVTLGAKINMLADNAKGDILWWIANDQVVKTPSWPGIIRRAAAKLPDGIGVLFPKDPMHPDHASYPIVTQALRHALGFIVPPCYPYWFVDTTVDEWGILLGERHQLPIDLESPEGRGKSHGLCDLDFWVRFYHALAPRRLQEGLILARAAFGETGAPIAEFMRTLGARQQLCAARVAHLSSPAFLARWGSNAASPPSPRYAEAKELAVKMLADMEAAHPKRPRVAIACPSGRTWEGTTGNALAAMGAYSTMHGVECAFLNVQASDIAHSRNSTVEIAMREKCDWIMWIDSDMRFPPDTLLRLLQHGKEIVGATYCKRVPDADGRYPTLGKLAGPKPDILTDGLHEALMLPGGVMLVKMDVYRRIGWPYYFWSFRWPGDDRLAAFKDMLRQSFATVPDETVLDSLDGTALGKWLAEHYRLGEFGDDAPTFSEDLGFCRKARRAGYQIWCDLRLTGDCAHLGQHEVTCKLGDEVVRLAPVL